MFWEYISNVIAHWWTLIPGIVLGLVDLGKYVFGYEFKFSPRVILAVFIAGLFVAQGFAWRDEHEKVLAQVTYFRLDTSFDAMPTHVPFFESGRIPSINIGYKNTGTYLADGATMNTALISVDMPDGLNEAPQSDADQGLRKLETEVWNDFTSGHVLHGGGTLSVEPGGHGWTTAKYDRVLSQDDVDAFVNRKRAMYLVGFTEWTDGNGTHEWPICYNIQPPADRFIVFAGCGSHNSFLVKAVN
jgi:hypothetical protein